MNRLSATCLYISNLKTSRTRTLALVLSAVFLGGCATFSEDGGFGNVEILTRERIGQEVKWIKNERDAEQVQAAVKKLLAAPLSVDSAVQIALLNNRGLQATYAELGIAEADLVERTFLFDVLGLITIPIRTELERRRFELTKLRVTADTLQVAADTRRAFFSAVAAQEAVKYMDQVKLAAEASAELARRMAAAGNFSKLDQSREQVFYAEVTAHLARVKQTALAERERLTRLMGLWGEDIRFSLPERLPDLPKTAREISDLEQQALKQRLDVQGAMKEAGNVAASLGLTKATGFINVLEVGYQRNSESGKPIQTGYEIELRLPIFDWGGARVARAEFTYMQAVNRAADIAVKARSEVRETYGAYRTAFDLARHYRDEIVPLRKRISEENLLRYNGMLISVFELLADARQQIASVNRYIEELRDYWIAESSLTLALTGKSPGATSTGRGGMQGVAGGAEQPGH
ncbi:MAG: TolC family protein [Betaproteobacteria bacterium]|nr:TolC family protein [Betaproteobacteria bacterium]